MQRILLIRLSAMGDIILTTPVIRMLKTRFPSAEIDILVKRQYAALLEHHPHLTNIYTFSSERGYHEFKRLMPLLKRRVYDGVIDLQTNIRSMLISRWCGAGKRVRYQNKRWKRALLVYFGYDSYDEAKPVPLRYLDALKDWGVEDDGSGSDLYLDPEWEKKIDDTLSGGGAEPLVLLAPGASRNTKRWSEQGFAEVGEYFQKRGHQVVVIGGPGDIQTAEAVTGKMTSGVRDYTGKLHPGETAALISRARLLICNDTGVMHMACALQTPVVALFGPTTVHLGFFPFRASASVVEKEINCRPCSYHGTDLCPKKHFRCMRDIEANQVIKAAEGLLNSLRTFT